MSWEAEHNRQIRANIVSVRIAPTAEDAEQASRDGLEQGFLYRNSCTELTDLWVEGAERYGPHSEPWPAAALDRLKAAFIARLQDAILPDGVTDELVRSPPCGDHLPPAGARPSTTPFTDARNRDILRNIEQVKAATTGREAEMASREGFGGSLMDRPSGAELKRMWAEFAEAYGSPSGPWPAPVLERFKAACVTCLRELLEDLAWDEGDDLAVVARKAKSAHFRDRGHLEVIPESIIERCWSEVERAPADDAVRILIYRFRNGVESGDLESGCAVKRLLDIASLRTGDPIDDIGHVLITDVRDGFRRPLYAALGERGGCAGLGIPEIYKYIHQNPMLAVEEAFFGLDRSDAEVLLGSLLMAGYRALLMNSNTPGTRLFTVLMGLREAYGFLRAGRTEPAEGSLRWCEQVIDGGSLGPLPAEVRNVLGQGFAAIGVAADGGGHSAVRVAVLERAAGLLEKQGNDYAECCFSLAEEYQRQGRGGEALDRYREALDTPGADDEQMKGLARTAVRMLRAELEGDAHKSFLNPDFIAEFGKLGEEFGYDHRVPVVMQNLMRHLLDRTETPQAAVTDAIKVLYPLITRFVETGQPADRILSMYKLVIGVAVSADDPDQLPVPVARLLAEADRFVLDADPGTAAEYTQLKAVALTAGPGPEGQKTCLADLRGLLNTQRAFEQPAPARPGGLRGWLADRRPAPPADEFFLEVDDPDKQLSVLQTACKFALVSGTAARRRFPVARAAEVAARSYQTCAAAAPTAEAMRFTRLGLDELIRTLGLLTFVYCGLGSAEYEADGLFLRHVPRADSDAETLRALDAYHHLLRVSSNAVLGRYSSEPLCAALARLPAPLQQEWTDGLAGLAAYRTQVDLALALTRDYKGSGDSRKPSAIIDRLREIRARAQLAGPGDRSAAPRAEVLPRGAAEVNLLDISPGRVPLVAGFAVEADRYHLWCSDRWTALARDYAEVPTTGDATRAFAALDEFHRVHAADPHASLPTLLDDPPGAARRVTSVGFRDLTNCDVPLGWVGDPGGDYTVSVLCNPSPPRAPAAPGAVIFWGRMTYQKPRPFVVDEAARRLVFPGPAEAVMAYPDGAPRGVMPGDSLPYAGYEKWLLQDTAAAAGRDVACHMDEAAGRSAFLAARWEGVGVLHLSTHGTAFPGKPECSYLLLSAEGGNDTFVLAADIMSKDWSALEVVFLNACLTTVGDKHVGEASLSVAWAFKAGGARAVIANRWYVGDEAAYFFAKCFYESWFFGARGLSVEDGFRSAVRGLQRHPRFRAPHQWGSFVLLR